MFIASLKRGFPWCPMGRTIISKVRLAPWIWRLGRKDVGRCILFEVSDFQTNPMFFAQPSMPPWRTIHRQGGRISKCGVWWSTVWESGEIQSVQVWGSWESWECSILPQKRGPRDSNLSNKNPVKSPKGRGEWEQEQKNTCKPIGPNCWVFSLKFEICINQNPLLHSKKGL